MEKKIIFFDIDGTIYSFFKGMPDDTLNAIKQLKKNGHIPVICTGRTKCMLYPEHLAPGFEYIIGGAGTYVEVDGEEIHFFELEENSSRRLIEGFREHGFIPVAEGKNNVYIDEIKGNISEKGRKFIDVYREKISDVILPIDENELKASKISGFFTDKSDANKMIEEFQDSYTFVFHGKTILEAIPKGFNKAKGIEILIDNLGLSIDETYAFGDSFNDVDMLKYVKYGCAMGNSDPKLFDIVKYKTTDFDKGGIEQGLKMFGLI